MPFAAVLLKSVWSALDESGRSILLSELKDNHPFDHSILSIFIEPDTMSLADPSTLFFSSPLYQPSLVLVIPGPLAFLRFSELAALHLHKNFVSPRTRLPR